MQALKGLRQRKTRPSAKQTQAFEHVQADIKSAVGAFMRRFESAHKKVGWQQNAYYAGCLNGTDCKKMTEKREDLFGLFDTMRVVD